MAADSAPRNIYPPGETLRRCWENLTRRLSLRDKGTLSPVPAITRPRLVFDSRPNFLEPPPSNNSPSETKIAYYEETLPGSESGEKLRYLPSKRDDVIIERTNIGVRTSPRLEKEMI